MDGRRPALAVGEGTALVKEIIGRRSSTDLSRGRAEVGVSGDQDMGGILRKKPVGGACGRTSGLLVIKEICMESIKKVSFVDGKHSTQDPRIIQHMLKTSIILKASDRINITPLLSTFTYHIITGQPIEEAQHIPDYLYGLYEIGHVSHKRKKNIALGHLVAYILEMEYELVHHDVTHLEDPLYYNDGLFRAIFAKYDEGANTEGEERGPTLAPGSGPNLHELVHRFDILECHFDRCFDQIETHLQQQDT
ncbi:hypothetical protein MA16_Dca001996 [Dendrobium catenatum]|uniref:Uncharacterized protein n=1 Tax=Dendrobium catenatum TaxID=906689 RepID=A0A2I0XE32_9ASPA|nr:hypothetical protein MA16_Dca001996 [Dendrobium catenatum]